MRDWHLMAQHLSRQGIAAARTGLTASGGDINKSLAYEIAQEKAANLGRLGRRLEAALAALEDFDRGRPALEGSGLAESGERKRLRAQAAQALWYLVVQREACGLSNTPQIMRDYRVPEEVRIRMGLQEATTLQVP
jgi:hypothetical protein